jgi:hypothetical protein
MHEIENKCITILVGVSEGRILLGRSKSRWELKVEMNFKEIRWDGVDWIHLAQKRDQRRRNELSGYIKLWECLEKLSNF